jgi:hypothetical protein
MDILFAHQNFPGQYKHLAAHFGTHARAVALLDEKNLARRTMPTGVTIMPYQSARAAGNATHPYLRTSEAAVLRGQAIARKALELCRTGFRPNVICVHAAWGEGLYLKDVFPEARILSFFEFYYHGEGADAV